MDVIKFSRKCITLTQICINVDVQRSRNLTPENEKRIKKRNNMVVR